MWTRRRVNMANAATDVLAFGVFAAFAAKSYADGMYGFTAWFVIVCAVSGWSLTVLVRNAS